MRERLQNALLESRLYHVLHVGAGGHAGRQELRLVGREESVVALCHEGADLEEREVGGEG